LLSIYLIPKGANTAISVLEHGEKVELVPWFYAGGVCNGLPAPRATDANCDHANLSLKNTIMVSMSVD
jgi:hypothetical protein